MSIGSFISGVMGGQDDFHADAAQTDPNAFQYGGQQGGAQARQDQLSGLGAAGVNYGNVQPYQSAQMGALGLDAAAAQGRAPSVAQNQLQQGLAESQANAASLAAGARGGGANLAAAMNQAGNAQVAQSAQANNQSAQLRAQEMAQARAQYGDLASTGVGQQAQMSQASASNQLGYEGLGNQVGLGQLNAQQNQQQINSQNINAANQINANVASGNAGAAGSAGGALLGAGANAASSLMSQSDENAKMNITPQSSGFGGSQPGGRGPAPKAGGGDFFSPSNYASDPGSPSGEAALMARDAHTANFAQMGNGMGNWFNESNAQPWTPESDAAHANLTHFMGMGSGNAGMPSNPNTRKLTLSDEHAKRALQSAETEGSLPRGLPPARNAAQAFAQSVHPVTYQYKDPRENGGHTRLGFLAQDIERSPTGRDLVKDTPRGKMVDIAALSNANAAVGGDHERRLSALEQAMQRAA